MLVAPAVAYPLCEYVIAVDASAKNVVDATYCACPALIDGLLPLPKGNDISAKLSALCAANVVEGIVEVDVAAVVRATATVMRYHPWLPDPGVKTVPDALAVCAVNVVSETITGVFPRTIWPELLVASVAPETGRDAPFTFTTVVAAPVEVTSPVKLDETNCWLELVPMIPAETGSDVRPVPPCGILSKPTALLTFGLVVVC